MEHWDQDEGVKAVIETLTVALRQKQERCGFDEFHKVAFFLRKKAVDGSGLG